jgi:hypothetical protein
MRFLAAWGLALSVLLMMPFAATDSAGQMASHEHQHEMAAGMPMNMPVGDQAFSEFSHHLAGAFVLAMALGELNLTLSMAVLTWTRFLLPLSMLSAGIFLLLWSDIDVWSFSNGFLHPFMIGDWETIQHKLYAVLLLSVGVIELLRRRGRLAGPWWRLPLPLFAIVGGVLLFLHTHHVLAGMDVIMLHHRIMGTTAILAGGCKCMPDIRRAGPASPGRPVWDLVWSVLLLLIGLELMLYFE